MQTLVPFVEYRVRIPVTLDQRVTRLLPDVAALRGQRRVTKTAVFEEALALWLAAHQHVAAAPSPLVESESTTT